MGLSTTFTGGAIDLIFPHHEAEITQMEATSGKKPIVRIWMHTGFLNVKGEKMSKSLDNFLTIEEMLKRCDADAFRLFVLLAHYRSPIDFSEEVLEQSKKSLQRIRHFIRIIEEMLEKTGESKDGKDEEIDVILAAAKGRFLEAMEDDFNTPNALGAIFNLVRDANRRINEKTMSRKGLMDMLKLLEEFGGILGIGFSPGSERTIEEDMTSRLIELLIDIRQKLRAKKDWKLADEVRNRMNELNVVLEDSQAGGKYTVRVEGCKKVSQ